MYVAASVLSLFQAVPWFGLQCQIVVFSDYTHFLEHRQYKDSNIQAKVQLKKKKN